MNGETIALTANDFFNDWTNYKENNSSRKCFEFIQLDQFENVCKTSGKIVTKSPNLVS